jgi:hypothetical protein
MRVMKKSDARGRLPEIAVAGFAILLVGCALAVNQAWFDRHFLPIFAFARPRMVSAERALRATIFLAGALLLLARRPVARALVWAGAAGMLRALLAVLLALGTAELALRLHPLYPHDADPLGLEPRRVPDARLGWRYLPSRSVIAREAGRAVAYSFDDASIRVSGPGAKIDRARPTLIFTGESIITGFGLDWDQTIPARVGASLGLQSANLAATDYSNDQSYLRLAAELPRFQKPVAVLTLFMPSLLERNLLDNRPHLGPGLVWQPPHQPWRLAALLHWLVPWHSMAAITLGIAHTHDSLNALVRLACARGAEPLIIVPQFGEATAVEDDLRRRVLGGLPVVLVRLDPEWHLRGDPHPDARGARAIAAAVAARLMRDGASASGTQRRTGCSATDLNRHGDIRPD